MCKELCESFLCICIYQLLVFKYILECRGFPFFQPFFFFFLISTYWPISKYNWVKYRVSLLSRGEANQLFYPRNHILFYDVHIINSTNSVRAILCAYVIRYICCIDTKIYNKGFIQNQLMHFSTQKLFDLFNLEASRIAASPSLEVMHIF